MYADRIAALAKYLEVEPSEIEHSGDGVFETGNQEWLVLTDDEATDRARTEIENSLWTFRTAFLRTHSKALAALDSLSMRAWEKIIGDSCESANPIVRALIDDFDHFVADAIKADGRGHFLAGYDGEERELRTADGDFLFAYRIG
jgi:hypothetical protein